MVDRCVSCGEIVPEGRFVCLTCENRTHIRDISFYRLRNEKKSVFKSSFSKLMGITKFAGKS